MNQLGQNNVSILGLLMNAPGVALVKEKERADKKARPAKGGGKP